MKPEKLPFLIDLFDDDSPEIRDEITKQLYNYGFGLEEDISGFSENIDEKKMRLIRPIVE